MCAKEPTALQQVETVCAEFHASPVIIFVILKGLARAVAMYVASVACIYAPTMSVASILYPRDHGD